MADYLVEDAQEFWANGEYSEDGTLNGAPKYKRSFPPGEMDAYLFYDGTNWVINDSDRGFYYKGGTNISDPTDGAWDKGVLPAPTVTKIGGGGDDTPTGNMFLMF